MTIAHKGEVLALLGTKSITFVTHNYAFIREKEVTRMGNVVTYLHNIPCGYRDELQRVVIRKGKAFCLQPVANLGRGPAHRAYTISATQPVFRGLNVVTGRINQVIYCRGFGFDQRVSSLKLMLMN